MQTLDTSILQERLKQIRSDDLQKEISAVASYLKESADLKVATITPKKVAKHKGLDSKSTLRAFLHMTKAGIFDMHWSVHCPHCRGGVAEFDSLDQVNEHNDCPMCKDEFDSNFDQSLEMKFKLNEAVGDLSHLDPWDVIGESLDLQPGITLELEPGETRTLERDLKHGNYALMVLGEKMGVNIPVIADAPSNSHVVNFETTKEPMHLLAAKLGPNTYTITAPNDRPISVLFSQMGEANWTDAATATTLQEFRDLFSKQLLSSQERFAIKNLSFVFTDIKGSTEMYERLGDSEAFSVVKEHFKILEDVVRINEGAIVKTIGDAIMAVFSDPAKAVHVTRDMIDAFDRYNLSKTQQNEITIKIGVHSGPCIAVTLNDRIDYFGTTVNTAARVQGLSDGRDIMLSEHVFNEGRVQESFSPDFWEYERFTTSLKGLSQNQKIIKLHRK